MAEEDESHECTNRSSSVSVSVSVSVKKANTHKKKVPQRGLGVAQLEKIRLQEENNNNIPPNSSIISPTNSFSSSSLPLQCTPIFKPNHNTNNVNDDDDDAVLSPSSPTDLPLFRPPIPIPTDVNNGNWWNGDYYDCGGENVGLPYESNTLTPNCPLLQRSPFSSSMVNVSSSAGTSSSSSSSAIEPPSNQSYCGKNNNYSTLMRPPDYKMWVGMKRPYPFILENAAGSCFPRFPHPPPPPYSSHISRYEELPSCSYGFTSPNIKPPIPVFREMPSISSGIERNPKRYTKDNAGVNGDFLTLAPPAMPLQNWRPRHFSLSPVPEFESLQYQEGGEDSFPVPRPIPGSVVSIQQPYISFLPSTENQNGGLAGSSSGSSSSYSEVRESVDLNLKL